MKTKSMLGCALALVMIASLTTPIQATNSEWTVNESGIWNYTKADGTLAKGWQMIDGCWYAFEADGTMKTGWIASDEKWYFMGGSGIMQENGWVKSDGADYYLKGNGIMATDYIKDGYELDSTGKSIPMTQTKSVELTEHMDINNKTIEGNLYIDAAKFKELELSGITVTGKVVIIGNNIKDSKISIKDSTVNTISTQARNAEIILAGKTVVESIQMEENATVKPDKDYTGKVATIEIQSTAKDEIKIEVPAKTVLTNTFAPVSINAPVDNLAVNKKTDLKVNADVDNITVNKTAANTKVEVEKDVTVGSVASDTKVEVTGSGKIENIKGEDVVIETPIPDKPAGGGSGGGGGGGVTPTPDEGVAQIGETKYANIYEAITNATSGQTITLLKDITLTKELVINKDITLDGNNKTLTISVNNLTINEKPNSVIVVSATGVTVKNLKITVSNKDVDWQGVYGIQVYSAMDVELAAITVSGADRGILVNGSEVTLKGNINVTDNQKGGIEVANGQGGVSGAHLIIDTGAEIHNLTETMLSPTLYLGNKDEDIENALTGGILYQGAIDNIEKEIHFYIKPENALRELLTNAIKGLGGNEIGTYSVDTDASKINAEFTNGEKTIKDLMGSGLFSTAIPSLTKASVTDIKIGGTSIVKGVQQANLKALLNALVFTISDSNVTLESVLGAKLSTLAGKSLVVVFTIATPMTSAPSVDATYTLGFSVSATSTTETGGISGSVEEWRPEIEIEL